jgi:Protein of unknown function (DUF1553)/Protein of unknown function (DUF1549)/Planctomycete cytochrome C
MKSASLLLLLAFAVHSSMAAGAPEANIPATIEFNRDIRPILSDNCFYCHGPDKNHRKAKLRLDIREDALEHEAFVPGKADESELIKRILTSDEEDLMPPKDSNKKLSARDKAVLKKWIAQGANYQLHWAYEKPVKTATPAGQNAVDVLIQKRLAALALHPSPEADRRTLVRRLSFDLLGLPPTPEQVKAFESDTSPNAYEKLVDSMLKNPHYGERMAIGWLDVVRFADTIGYHSDTPRNVWPYRDYVIKAFNENKRFDRFTIEQIAGDLMPNSSQESKVASAFNRLILSTEEGGAQAKDYEARMLTDRVRAIGTAWMGQTTGCCQCHDHKFDPITTRDFYALGAFFSDIKESIIGKREEGMVITTPAQAQQLAKADAALESAKKKHAAIAPMLDAAQRQWEDDIATYEIKLPELQEKSQASAEDKKLAQQVAATLKKGASKEARAKQAAAVQTYFRTKVTKLYAPEREALAKAEANRAAIYNPLPKCLVSISDPNKRAVRILPRGNWMDESGEVMKAALPAYLPQKKVEGRDLTRLDLAEWLVAKENPLTARTVMNRLWAQFFGTGLSKVLSDLGAQGEPPANGPLLDWLACEFMDSGWDFQHMVRTIVTSAAYRQTSIASKELVAADPYNRECARQSPFRLEAELVRDNALAISGLLVPNIGGPSAKPYQPAKYWENLNFPTREWQNDAGEGLYRRGLYTWWQRSYLHPSLVAFDAPSREECAAERNRSNIPQQALVLLNDPTYVEAARVFAARILSECKGTPEDRITWAWQQALQRKPTADELNTVSALLSKHLADYKQDDTAAEELLKTGAAPVASNSDKSELAAWTHVARVALNLHETITRS